ncbi:MAG: methionine--tRNA ligase, partial [Mycoplasmataceae bacterium]|nr:methionine--tRNA ligase [Mycoplasmataceae bacterium]
MKDKKFYVTTPIYYPSGKPHIGHAFTTIYADVLCRYKKLIGFDAFMLTGMDEHGQKIERAAKEANKSPKEYVDEMGKVFFDLWKLLNINYSGFIKTSDPQHEQVVQQVFQEFQDNKYIYMGEWTGLYCISCEENYTEQQAHKNEHDEWLCQFGHKLTYRKEPSLFFKMSEFTSWIKQWYSDHPEFIIPAARVNELINSFLHDSLQDLSVSRSTFTWGVPVLSNPEHVIYVWIDALLNYLTALGYRTKNDQLFQKYWMDPNCEIVHIMSKEITRFHCIYWPIMLHCLKLRQPSKIVSHGWIVTKEGKMSKSLGNVIDPIVYVKQYGADALRYFLMKEMSLDRDGIFSHDLFIECFNADLANIFGNLVSRLLGMVHKYNNGTVQKGTAPISAITKELIEHGEKVIQEVVNDINNYRINDLIDHILTFAKRANRYVEETKPWELVK